MAGQTGMICSLDYLVGTLATAYKGVITSLVVKDFCICQRDGSTQLKGAVLSMPAGDYHASLIKDGVQLARCPIAGNGEFEMLAGSGSVMEARDLQIDILQNGRHIGTFLLKKERSGVFYTPAVELSEEVKDIDFKLLTLPLREKPGLLKKAEDVIYEILSAKKDWGKLSDKLQGFATDLFWGQRDTFYAGFGILARFSFLALEKTGMGRDSEKAAENCLDLIGLPLSKETVAEKLGGPVRIWLEALKGAAARGLAGLPGRSARIFSMISEKVPEADVRPHLLALVSSFIGRVEGAPAFSEAALGGIRGFFPQQTAFESMEKWGSRGRDRLLSRLAEVRSLAEKGLVRESLLEMEGAKAELESFLDGVAMARAFFDAAKMHLSRDGAPGFVQAFFELLDIAQDDVLGAGKEILAGAEGFMRRLIVAGRADLCADLLSKAAAHGGMKNGVVLNKDIASLVLDSGDNGLISFYRELLKGTLVPPPGIRGYSPESWAETADPLHLDVLSRFLDVLSVSGGGLEDVKAHLVCNFYVSGVFIPDDRLFQRRVSAYLNSPAMLGDFLLNYMLLRKLPVYFSEIGAASLIRDYTTQVDSWGNDTVLYFLRKQVHVNASNYNIRLAEGIIRAWVDSDRGLLEALVPPDVFRSFNKGLLGIYHRAMTPFFEALGVLGGGDRREHREVLFGRLLEAPEELMAREIEKIDAPREIRSKVFLLCRIYQEIVKKYSMPFSGAPAEGQEMYSALGECLQKMGKLKETFLSPAKTEPVENLYFKRHIAFGIPSVIGTYREEKFDALGDFFRTGEKARVLMEGIITGISNGEKANRKEKEKKTDAPIPLGEEIKEWEVPARWASALTQTNGILGLHGIRNFQVDELSVIFSADRLFISQALDMLRMWQKELKWEVESFGRQLLAPLARVLNAIPQDGLPDYLSNLSRDDPDFVDKAADIIIRDMMSGLPGFTETDRLIDAMAGSLSARLEGHGDAVFNLHMPEEKADFFELDGLGDDAAMRLSPIIGGKAKNLVYLKNRGFDVPPGVVFPSGRTGDYMAYTESEDFARTLKEAVRKVEERSGKIFGGAEKPLFLSVRSGSYISMPGILTTILYCGMNDETLKGFIRETGDAWLAWDSYRRFLEHYGVAVLGLNPKVFEGIKEDARKTAGAASLKEMGGEQIGGIARAYLEAVSRMGLSVPDDVYGQLKNSVRAVYASWNKEKSAQFARFTGMSRRWGTAVSLMQMIYGNQPGAGAAVFFTRDPATMEKRIYGEIRETATGDDLVYGARNNMPVSRKQNERFGDGGNTSLEESDPELFDMLGGLARKIEDAFGGLPEEVETTYCKTDGQRKVYVLQARRMEFYDSGFIPRFEEICLMEPRMIGKGIGVYGGALSGVASFSFSAEAVRELGRSAGLPVIILRHSASTNDVSLMMDIGGIITAAGGATSHASVLAQKFGLTAIVGCKDLAFEASREGRPYARIGKAVISEGTPISIDGATGLIFSGTCLHTTKGR